MPEMNLGTAEGRIVIDASQAKKGAKEASDAVKGATKEQEAAAGRLKSQASTAAKAYGVAVVGGFTLAIKAAANFEQALANVAAAGGKDAEGQMEAIRKKALQLGADTTFSALEAAGAMEALIKAGLSVDEVLNGAADAAVNLAAAESIDLTQAAEIAATAMTAFNLKASEMPKIADKISQSASATKMDVSDFAQAMNQAGAVSKTVGLSFDDMSLAITALGKAGIIGSDAGTSLKTMLLNLQPQTNKQKELFKELGIVTKDGANQFFTAKGEIKSMTEIAGVLGNALKGMTKEQKLAALETLFGADAIRAASVLADRGAKGMKNLAKEMNNQLTVAEKAKVKQDTLSGSLEQLSGSAETAAIQFGTAMLPAIRAIADFLTVLTNAFAALPEPVQQIIAGFLALSTAALAFGWVGLKVYRTVRDIKTVLGGMKVFSLFASGIGTAKTALGVWAITAVDGMKKAAIASASAAKSFVVAFASMIASAASATAAMVAAAARHAALWIRMAAVAVARAAVIAAAWLAANPLALIAAALIAIGVLIYKNWDKVVGFFKRTWESIRGFFSRNAETIKTILRVLGRVMLGIMTFGMSELVGVIVRNWHSIIGWFERLPGNIKNALGNLGSLLWNAGIDLLKGFWRGIVSAKDWLLRKIGDFFRWLLPGWVQDMLGISSPSKVFAKFGQFTIEGYIVGLEDMENQAKRTVARIAASIIEAGSLGNGAVSTGMEARAVIDRGSVMSPGVVSVAAPPSAPASITVGNLTLHVTGNLDPTNPIAWRQAIVSIKEGIRSVERQNQ